MVPDNEYQHRTIAIFIANIEKIENAIYEEN